MRDLHVPESATSGARRLRHDQRPKVTVSKSATFSVSRPRSADAPDCRRYDAPSVTHHRADAAAAGALLTGDGFYFGRDD